MKSYSKVSLFLLFFFFANMDPTTMRAVVFKGVKSVAVEQRPVPTIQDPKDVVVKVKHTALCGR